MPPRDQPGAAIISAGGTRPPCRTIGTRDAGHLALLLVGVPRFHQPKIYYCHHRLVNGNQCPNAMSPASDPSRSNPWAVRGERRSEKVGTWAGAYPTDRMVGVVGGGQVCTKPSAKLETTLRRHVEGTLTSRTRLAPSGGDVLHREEDLFLCGFTSGRLALSVALVTPQEYGVSRAAFHGPRGTSLRSDRQK